MTWYQRFLAPLLLAAALAASQEEGVVVDTSTETIVPAADLSTPGCCFSIGYGTMMKPVSLSSKVVSGRHTCATRQRIGGATGYHAGACPETAEEAAALLKAEAFLQGASQGPVNGGSAAKTSLAVIGAMGVLAAVLFVARVRREGNDVDGRPFICLDEGDAVAVI